jgi:hypothetical protein
VLNLNQCTQCVSFSRIVENIEGHSTHENIRQIILVGHFDSRIQMHPCRHHNSCEDRLRRLFIADSHQCCMTPAEEMRRQLDALMGTSRNDSTSRSQHFTDPEICRNFCCGLCPHDLFTNTVSLCEVNSLLLYLYYRKRTWDLVQNCTAWYFAYSPRDFIYLFAFFYRSCLAYETTLRN